jgi:1-acyl-sn-glycerol-3-phosphate acyltransferase
MQLAGSILFTAFANVWTFVYGILYVFITPPLSFKGRFAVAAFHSQVVVWMARLLCGIRYEVQGRENLPAGNHIIYMKHSSTWETYAQMILFPPLVWVMKRELLWIPFVGWGCMLARCIAIDRKAGAAAVNQVLAQGKDRLAMGAWVMIFPEGTRVAPGEKRKYGSSGALLAAAENRKVVPVAHNAGLFWPRRGLLKRRGTIRVVIGPAIETAGRDAREVNADAQAWIEANVLPATDEQS